MPALNEFLLARIAEDEATALSASNPPWVALTFYPNRSEVTNETEIDGGVIVRTPSKDDADVEHIARHDPARVLAECEAKRQIVAEHEMTTIRRAPGLVRDPDGDYWWNAYCRRCTMDGEYADITKEPSEQPCPTLRALAGVYADHPDYREEWKP